MKVSPLETRRIKHSQKTLLRTNLVMSSSITVFYSESGILRMMLAYVGYITPSVLLLMLIAFYDPNTTICYRFESTFLLDNTQEPRFSSRFANESIVDEFRIFHHKFFSQNQSANLNYGEYTYGEHYYYYDENHDYNYYLHTTEVENSFTWEDYLENLSIPNKYLLLKILRIKGTLGFHAGERLSRNYYLQILASFKSSDCIENLLSLLREFGFLNFCLGTSKLNPHEEGARNSLSVMGWPHSVLKHCWS